MDLSKFLPGGVAGKILASWIDEKLRPTMISVIDRCVLIAVAAEPPPLYLADCLKAEGFASDPEVVNKLHRAYVRACALQPELPTDPPLAHESLAAQNGARSE